MAAVVQEAATTNVSTAADPWTVNMPVTGNQPGDVFYMQLRTAGATGLNGGALTGWTVLINSSADASDDINYLLRRVSDGSEGATQSVDMAGTVKGGAVVFRVRGAAITGTIEETGITTSVGANMDPPSVTVTGGPKDMLALTFAYMDGETATFTQPSGYSSPSAAYSGTAGAVATNTSQAGAHLVLGSTSTVNPGAWTNGAPATASGATVVTVAVHPAPAPTQLALVNMCQNWRWL